MLNNIKKKINILNNLGYIFSGANKSKIILLFILIFLTVVLEAFSISFVLPTVTALLNPSSSNPIFNFYIQLISDYQIENLSLFFLIALLIIFGIKNLLTALLIYKKADLINELNFLLSNSLFKKYMSQNYKFITNFQTSNIIRNINTETSLTVSSVNQLLTLFLELFVLVGIFAFLCFVNFWITALSFIIIGFFLWIFTLFTKNKTNYWGQIRQDTDAERIKTVQDTFGGIKEIKIYNLEESAFKQFFNFNINFLNAGKFVQVITQYPRLWLEFLVILTVCLIVISLNFRGYAPNDIISILAMFGVAIFRIMPSANRLSMTFISIRYALPAINKTYEELKKLSIYEKENYEKNKITNEDDLNFNKEIKFKNVEFRYLDRGKKSINNTNITINRGDCIGIEGPNGSGKSTFVDLLVGLLEPTEGKILVDDININNHLAVWRNKIGYVPQNPYFLSDTITNNIIFGGEKTEKKLEKVLEISGLSKFKDDFEKGLNTNIGEKGLKISGGQKKKIAIARALYKKPEILIFDEATAALDKNSIDNLLKTLEFLKRNTKTIFVISHQKEIFQMCNKILAFDNGNIKFLEKNK